MASLGCRAGLVLPGPSSRGDEGPFFPADLTAPKHDDPYWLDDDDILACVPLEASIEDEELTTAVLPFCDVPPADTASWKGQWGKPQNIWAPLQMDAALPNPFSDAQPSMSLGCAAPADLSTAAYWSVGGVGGTCSSLGAAAQAPSPSGLWPAPCKAEPTPDLPAFSPAGPLTHALTLHSSDLDSFCSSTPCSASGDQPFSKHGANDMSAARSGSTYSEQELVWAQEAWPEPPASTEQARKKRSASAAACTSSRQSARRGSTGGGLSGLERSRDVQRKYLQRKRVKVDALFARLESLKARKAALEKSVAPLLKEYAVHTEGFSLHQMQEESKFLASVGTGVHVVLAALHKASSTPDAPPGPFFTLLAEASQLGRCDDGEGAAGGNCTLPHAIRSLVARLRMTKKQRDVLVEQTEEARKQVAELRAERSVLAARLQALATRWVDASTMPWLGASLAAHLIAGRLCGLASRERGLLASLLLACLAAVKGSYQALISDSVVGMHMDVYALCLEMIVSPRAPDAEHE